jgi:hypothetical protein
VDNRFVQIVGASERDSQVILSASRIRIKLRFPYVGETALRSAALF